MHFKPKINLCLVFTQIRQHREIRRRKKNQCKCLLPLTARGEDHSSSRVQGGWLKSFRLVLRLNSRARMEREDYNQPAFPFPFNEQ